MRLVSTCTALLVLAFGGGCDDSSSPSGKAGSKLCSGECLPVPQGIKGLTFGMSSERAIEALGGKRLHRAFPSKILPSITRSAEYDAIPAKVRARAKRKATLARWTKMARIKTTLGTEPAHCRLAFAVDQGLSHIACEIVSTRTKKHYKKVFDTIRARLEARHGAAEIAGPMLTWRDEHARLILLGQTQGRGTISLFNTSAAHTELVSELRAKATRQYHQELDEYLAKTRAAAADREARAKKAGKAWDRDLSPALENGK